MPAERVLRPGLLAVAASASVVAVPATVAPHAFFRLFPFVAHWVDRLGEYNEHLTTDVGVTYLAVAALFVRAAITLDRGLVLPLCLAWAGAQSVHLAFHTSHLHGFPVEDAVLQTLTLAVAAALPAVLAFISWRGSSSKCQRPWA